MWQIQFIQLLLVYIEILNDSNISIIFHLPWNVIPWVYTKKQDYYDVRIAVTLLVNANTATSCLSQRKTIYQVPKCKIYPKIDWNIKAISARRLPVKTNLCTMVLSRDRVKWTATQYGTLLIKDLFQHAYSIPKSQMWPVALSMIVCG